MTTVRFADVRSVSKGERYTAEALSPENGSIPFPDSVPESERRPNSFGFQRHFRYRLYDSKQRVVWERWQGEREDSPEELYVSDDGDVVARLHGHGAAPLVAFDKGGQPRIVVMLMPDGLAPSIRQDVARDSGFSARVVPWSDPNVQFTTAGIWWAMNSIGYFFDWNGAHYFAIRCAWGRRILLNLGSYELTAEPASGLIERLESAEAELARKVVRAAADSLPATEPTGGLPAGYGDDEDEDPVKSMPDPARVCACIDVVGALKLRDMLPALRALEGVSSWAYSTSSHAFEGDAFSQGLHAQHVRPIVQQSLWRIGERPRRYANYAFTQDADDDGETLIKMPDPAPELEPLVPKLNSEMRAAEVLALLGSPTFAKSSSTEIAPRKFIWGETWEYDLMRGGTASTLCIKWSGEKKGSIERIEEVKPARWQELPGRPYLFH
jgi:hypothetical protein